MGIFESKKVLSPEARRDISNQKIKKMKITCSENLPTIESSKNVELKSLDVVCKRAIACLISTQLACSIAQNEDYHYARDLFYGLLIKYGVEHDLLPKEKALFSGTFIKQDVIDVAWCYEAYWAIIWAMDLISNKEVGDATATCNTERAVAILLSTSEDYTFFKSICSLKNTDRILDMLDLYYRYHWACLYKRIHPETSIGRLNPEVVRERRKGLEWLISAEEDWGNIPLNRF